MRPWEWQRVELDWWSELQAARLIWHQAHKGSEKRLAALEQREQAVEQQQQQADAALNDFVARAMNPERMN